jgi:hypothetical protein
MCFSIASALLPDPGGEPDFQDSSHNATAMRRRSDFRSVSLVNSLIAASYRARSWSSRRLSIEPRFLPRLTESGVAIDM